MSTGVWSAVGPRDQQDVAEFLEWACTQPWSNGQIGLYGFSASAIAVYNSMHLPLACVKAAALMAGTNDLYRDLLYPGGIPNIVPGFVVGFGVGLPILAASPQRFQEGQSPLEPLAAGIGILGLAIDLNAHPTEDEYWLARTQRPGPNTFPVLANTGFYDVESRGPFESYQMLRDEGVPVHLRVLGAHDGVPAGTPGPFPEYRRWFDRFLLGTENGIDAEPRVQLLLGQRELRGADRRGRHARRAATIGHCRARAGSALYLDGKRGGGAVSTNDGTLAAAPPAAQVRLPHVALTSLPTATDPNTTSTVAAGGASALFEAVPLLTQLALVEPLALTWSTPRFAADLDVDRTGEPRDPRRDAAPGRRSLRDRRRRVARRQLARRRHRAAAHELSARRRRALADRRRGPDGAAVPGPLQRRRRRRRSRRASTASSSGRSAIASPAGHRLRVYLVGAPAYQLPAPNLGFVSVGGATPSRLLLPVAPGQDFCASLPSSC